MSTQPNALRLADELDAYHTRSGHKEAAIEPRSQHEIIQKLTAAPNIAVDLVHSGVIRVRESDRQKLIDALTGWHSAIRAAEAHK